MIKGSIEEEDITIVNIYAPNIGESQYIRQMLTAIEGEIESNTIIVGWASLVAQWLRICLPVQGTRVRALVRKDPTCHRATTPMSHNY